MAGSRRGQDLVLAVNLRHLCTTVTPESRGNRERWRTLPPPLKALPDKRFDYFLRLEPGPDFLPSCLLAPHLRRHDFES